MRRWWRWLRQLHWHQWYMRLPDGELECTTCHRIKKET